MVTVGAKKRQTGQRPPQQGHAGVGNRQAQREHWSEQRGQHRSFVGIGNRQSGDQKPEQIRAAVAHVNPRGWKVVAKESQQRAGHPARHQEREVLRAPADVNQQPHQHETNPAGQTVDAIDEIHEVRHAHQPEHGGGQTQQTQRMFAAGDRVFKHVKAESAVERQLFAADAPVLIEHERNEKEEGPMYVEIDAECASQFP